VPLLAVLEFLLNIFYKWQPESMQHNITYNFLKAVYFIKAVFFH